MAMPTRAALPGDIDMFLICLPLGSRCYNVYRVYLKLPLSALRLLSLATPNMLPRRVQRRLRDPCARRAADYFGR